MVLGAAALLPPSASAQVGSLVVNITSPANNATVSATIPVNASVTMVGGLIAAGVQFKLDGANLGAEDTSSPYSVQWNTTTASNGSHTLVAVARDVFGGLWSSGAITVTVFNDLTPPTVSITSPSPGASVRGAISIAASASDNVGVAGVQFKIDGANFGAEDTSAPYGVSWDTSASANGSHTLTAVARDAAGNTTTSVAVTMTVDNSAPTAAIASPSAGAIVAGAITVTGTATDNIAVAGVQFKVDGAALGAEDVTAPFAAAWNTATASNGSHTLTAVARDAAGNTTTSAAVTVTVDNSAPAAAITSPAAGSLLIGAITVTADATDNVAVAGVQFRVDGAALGAEDVTAPFSVAWDTATASNGSHTLTAVARDTAGNLTTSAGIAVSVDNGAPVVSVTSPVAGSNVSGSIAVSATATDNAAVAGVQFRLDGAALGAEDTVAPYSVDWDTTTTTNGSHVLSAVARDTAGNTSTSINVTVNVVNDAAPPAVAITSPANGATVSATVIITANASDDIAVAGVQFRVDGVALGAEDTTAPYDVSWDTTTAGSGSHTLTAVARDAAGHTTTSSAVTVTVGNASTVTRVEDNGGVITFTPAAAWIEGYTDSRGWSGGTAALGFGAGQRATLNFTGTGASWIGFRGPQTGIANVYLDGALVATIDAYSPTEIVQSTLYTASGLANGAHTLVIEVTRTKNDAANDYYVIVDAIDVTSQGGGAPDTTAPTVSVSSPAGGATVSGTVAITANAADNVGVVGVKFFVDGTQIGAEDTTAPYSASWNTSTAGEGTHTITAQARDAAGNTTTSAGVSVTVSNTDTTPPAVAISSPSAGATVFGTVTITANASDNIAVAGVQFFVDGVALGAEDTSAPYSASWDTATAANGSHALTARARDGAGNTTLSSAVSVTVTNGPGSNVRIEDGNTAITYHGSWNVGNASRPWSGGTAAIGFGLGQDAVVSFRGTGITWIGFRGPWTGIANVYVDGAFNSAIDLYAAAEAVQAPVFTVSSLPLGAHTLTIEVTHTKNASSSDYVVIVDAFDIIDAPPDTTAPSVSITSPAGGATVFATIPVTASADDDSGVASVTFFVDGVQLGTADTISPYAINWNTTTVTDGPHTLTAVARDAAGNTTTSAAVAVTVANSAPPALATATRIENTNLGIVYADGCATCGQVAGWFHGSRSRTWSDGTASFNRADGGRATYSFTGTAVKWIGFRAAWAGIARVFVDGAFVTEVDLFSPTEEVQVPVFQVSDLTPGNHTIAVEATGRKNPEAQDYAVVVDAFDVSPGLPPPVNGTRYEENSSSATFTSGWNTTDASQAWSGGTAAVASVAAERATFTFTGNAVKWVGKRGPDMGIARVYLDGTLQATIDSYFPSTIQGLLYSASGLAPGEHRLEIEVTGTKNSQATGQAIAVDAWDVRSRIEESHTPVVYSGLWSFNDVARNWSDTSLPGGTGTASYSAMAGAAADLTFKGTAVTWVGMRGPILGIANVYLDGAFAQQIDLYSATEEVQAPLFTASGLASGTHTLRVEATGTRNPAAATARVYIDTFDVTLPSPAPRVTRVAESDAAITYSAGWVASGTSSLWSGATAKESRTVGAQATFSFTGTSVRWLGERGFTTGLARVSIDGQFVGVVETRTPFQEQYQEPVFTASGLAPGTHTLTIEIIGRNNEAAGTLVERVVIDAFEVYPN